MLSSRARTTLLAELLREGRSSSWPADLPAELFIETAEDHGVLPLLSDIVTQIPNAPLPVSRLCRSVAMSYAAIDAARERHVRAVLGGLQSAGVRALLFKGEHFAYAYYDQPHHRPRLDTDILLAGEDRPAASGALARLGYAVVPQVGGDLLMYQQAFNRHVDAGFAHVVDLHWRLFNPQVFGRVLEFNELFEQSICLERLAGDVRVPGPVHSLMIACLHRVVHHANAGRLIWLVDIARIARTFDRSHWSTFTSLAADRQLGRVCHESLSLAAREVGATIPAGVLTQLNASGTRTTSTSRYLAPSRRHFWDVLTDIRALPAWADRWRLVSQHLFPSGRYMRTVYAPSSRAPLPVLYARRALRGARRWLVRP